MDEIKTYIRATCNATRTVETQLLVLSGLCESDGTIGTNTRDVISEGIRRAEKNRPDGTLPHYASRQTIYQEVTDNWKPIDEHLTLNGSDVECAELT
jgi:hypothetical protein